MTFKKGVFSRSEKIAWVALSVAIGWWAYVDFWNYISSTQEDWYLGCVGEDAKEYLIKVQQRPRIKDGFIIIGEDMFVTPRPMTTCRAIRAVEFEKNLKDVKSQKIL